MYGVETCIDNRRFNSAKFNKKKQQPILQVLREICVNG